MAAIPRFPWIVVSAVAAIGVVAAVTWLQVPASGPVISGSGLPALGLTRPGMTPDAEIIAEQLAAYDPTPLFVPTDLSSSQALPPKEFQREQEGPFAKLPPELVKAGPLAFPPDVTLPGGPRAGLSLTERLDAPLSLSRKDNAGSGLPARPGYLEAVRVDTGRVLVAITLPASARPPDADWQPLELMGAVTRTGLAGGLVITATSGSDEIDAYFRSYLAENVRIAERLPPGLYAFRVGP